MIRRIQICAVHDRPEHEGQGLCWLGIEKGFRTKSKSYSCRMVPMRLIPDNAEKTKWTPKRLRHLASQAPHWSGAHHDLALAAMEYADILAALDGETP